MPRGREGSEPGELPAPRFVAVDNSSGPSDGDVYVERVWVGIRRTRNGKFINQKATGGEFTLTFEGETTAEIP